MYRVNMFSHNCYSFFLSQLILYSSNIKYCAYYKSTNYFINPSLSINKEAFKATFEF